jgi:hypothetical protein
MAGTISVYTFEHRRADGEYETYNGSYATQDYQQAKAYAQSVGLRIVANEYEWADSEPLDDYTRTPNALTDEEIAEAYGDTGGYEVLHAHCHGEGTLDMLKCRECNAELGSFHAPDCELVVSGAIHDR